MKDVGLRIRVQKELREQFLQACRAQDIPASQVLRGFMREYVETNTTGAAGLCRAQERKPLSKGVAATKD